MSDSDSITSREIDASREKEQSATGLSNSRPSFRARQVLVAALFLGLAMGSNAEDAVTSLYRRKEFAESSTTDYEVDGEVMDETLDVFRRGSEEFFMDGYSTDFSKRLKRLIEKHGKSAVRAIADYILTGSAKPDTIAEALKWLSDFTDRSSLSLRWHLLERTLRHPSPIVRDGAITGFASLDDRRAIPLLTPIGQGEPIRELRTLVNQVIEQLARPR